uniref:Integrin subunit alpha 6 n=1 Tax=Poecilia latipinna TaxID=48699 RepID=A0A3B3UJ90_9TELE
AGPAGSYLLDRWTRVDLAAMALGLRAFNLDTRHVIRKGGEPGSLFGLSLALHQQVSPNKVLLLIGAPRAKALKNQKSSVTGGLFKCEISESDNCERVEFDNDEDPSKESKEDQWMGVSVQSQGPGGKVVVPTLVSYLPTKQTVHNVCVSLGQ